MINPMVVLQFQYCTPERLAFRLEFTLQTIIANKYSLLDSRTRSLKPNEVSNNYVTDLSIKTLNPLTAKSRSHRLTYLPQSHSKREATRADNIIFSYIFLRRLSYSKFCSTHITT